MPLKSGNANIGANIKELTENGSKPRPHKQIVAIALSEARKKPKYPDVHMYGRRRPS